MTAIHGPCLPSARARQPFPVTTGVDPDMNAVDALKRFVKEALLADKARRYTALLETKKGLRKIADDFLRGNITSVLLCKMS